MAIQLRACYDIGDRATLSLRFLCHFYIKIGGLTGLIIIIIIIIIIITLFQEDNIFCRVASLTYGPQLTNVGMIL